MPTRVISGGATGADTLARQWAEENLIPMREHLPESKTAAAYKARNTPIVNDSHLIVAFVAQDSRGTWDTINKAQKAGKSVIIFSV